jgi:hypothetical protein
MEDKIWGIFFISSLVIMFLLASFSFILRLEGLFLLTQPVQLIINQSVENTSAQTVVLPKKLSNPPQIIKAVYVTAYSAGSKSYLRYLSQLFKTTEINAVVVDIKGSGGAVSYNSGAPDVAKYRLSDYAISDINSLVDFFHNQNVYVIGRVTVFEDPGYAKARPNLAIYNTEKTTDSTKPVLWQDSARQYWMDPASKEVWDYNISLAKDAFLHGFDEINFDYIRFPSDGKISKMGYPVYDNKTPKRTIIKNFFRYVREQLAGEKISADLFGQTTINKDDMGIGQQIEDAFDYFDYLAPMVYPSHYANGFIGFTNPADHPYEIVKYSLDSGVQRQAASALQGGASANQAKFRPWLQDFNVGAYYTANMVKAEIKATQDSLGKDFNGFMLWNPSNVYTKEAILKPI